MAVTQIVGPRIAPLWADPVEWTSTRAYEPFTFVTYQGDSYCSRQDTPIGIDIKNEDYWVKISDYNAQAVALQRSMTNTIETAETNMEAAIQAGKNDITAATNTAQANMNQAVADVNAVKNEFQSSLYQVATNKLDISAAKSDISAEKTRAEGAERANATAIDAEKTRAEGAENNLQTNINKNATDICPDVLFIGDSYMEGYSPDGNLTSFAAMVKNKLEQSSNRHAYIVCKGGYSFVNGNWLSLLTAWVNSQTKETLDRIGNIYICGGANDRHNTHIEIDAAEKNFFDYCHTKFINARYTVFFIGAGCVGNATQHTNVLNNKFVNVVNAYMYNSFVLGYSFVNGSGIVKFNKYLSSDFFHPNQLGQNWLAANLLNVVNGGNKAFTYGEKFPGITLFKSVPDFQNNGDNYKLADGSGFILSVYNPNFTDCAGEYPWCGYEISNCIGHLNFDTSGVSQDWYNKTLEICTLPNEAIYQAPAGNYLNVVRKWPVSIQYQIASESGKSLPAGVSPHAFFADSGTLMIHGNKVYLNLNLITPLRGSAEGAYLKFPIKQLLFTYVTNATLPEIPEQ